MLLKSLSQRPSAEPTWNSKPIPGSPHWILKLFLPSCHPLHTPYPWGYMTHVPYVPEPLNLTNPTDHFCLSSVVHSGQLSVPSPGAFSDTQMKYHCYKA